MALSNTGINALSVERYGSEIIIERLVMKTGASRYRLLGRPDRALPPPPFAFPHSLCGFWEISMASGEPHRPRAERGG